MKRITPLALFGLLLLAPAAQASTEEARSRVVPWSGHWWPMRRGQMVKGYRDDTSPLRKHDKVTGSNASDWERKNHFDEDYPKWYGHCHGWAAAAATEIEPTGSITYKGVNFRVGDIKALLTEGHYGDKATLFGQRNIGGNSDPSDIAPDQLWKICQEYMGEQGMPLLMDLDNSKEVWTYPVYGYRIDYNRSDEGRDLYECQLTLFVSNTTVPPDFVGSLLLRKQYTFEVKMKNGVIEEGTGRWTGKSRSKHPDYAWYPASRGQENTGLVHGLAQKLAELASEEAAGDRGALMERLAARDEWDRAQGNQDVVPGSSGAPVPELPDGPLVANPALPDLAVTRRRQGSPVAARSTPPAATNSPHSPRLHTPRPARPPNRSPLL